MGYEARASQLALLDMSEQLASSEFVHTCSSNWYLGLLQFANDAFPSAVTSEGIIDPAEFYNVLSAFLSSENGARYQAALVLDDMTGVIRMSEIACEFGTITANDQQVEATDAVRSIVDSFPELGDLTVATARGDATFPFAYSYVFLFYDGLEVIRMETLRNVLIAGVAVAIVTLILLANVVSSFIVVAMLALVDVNVLGFMYYVNVDFNSVSAVNIVIAVGLAIDSSVHIAHAFLTAHGTRNERAREALRRLGRSVTNGAVSTFLAIVVLADAQSYIFRVLFKLLGLIIMFAYFHGVFVLPVVLSLIGPDPYPLKQHELDGLDEDDGTDAGTPTGRPSPKPITTADAGTERSGRRKDETDVERADAQHTDNTIAPVAAIASV